MVVRIKDINAELQAFSLDTRYGTNNFAETIVIAKSVVMALEPRAALWTQWIAEKNETARSALISTISLAEVVAYHVERYTENDFSWTRVIQIVRNTGEIKRPASFDGFSEIAIAQIKDRFPDVIVSLMPNEGSRPVKRIVQDLARLIIWWEVYEFLHQHRYGDLFLKE